MIFPPAFCGGLIEARTSRARGSLGKHSPPLFAGASLKRAIRIDVPGGDHSPPLFAGASLKLAGFGDPAGAAEIPPRFFPPAFCGGLIEAI